jgi:hypothetical protein
MNFFGVPAGELGSAQADDVPFGIQWLNYARICCTAIAFVFAEKCMIFPTTLLPGGTR